MLFFWGGGGGGDDHHPHKLCKAGGHGKPRVSRASTIGATNKLLKPKNNNNNKKHNGV